MTIKERKILEMPDGTDKGTSIKKLIPGMEASYKGSGPRISETVYWLADAIETPVFWDNLQTHLIDSAPHIRHSVGGVFYGDSGEQTVEEHSWYEIHRSLDDFLRRYGGRASEYLFRDFRPETQDPYLSNRIRAARATALDRFPRLRRMYWDDYQEVLETPTFWHAMIRDLEGIKGKISPTKFFDHEVTTTNRTDLIHLETEMERYMLRRLISQAGHMDKRAQLLDYRSMSQIIREVFQQNPRVFFLNYKSTKNDPVIEGMIAQAKVLIAEKTLPVRQQKERPVFISKKELEEHTSGIEFWQALAQDLDQYSLAQNLTYNFDTFLRYYDVDENEIIHSRIGIYAYIPTAFLEPRQIKGQLMPELRLPSKEASYYLMWQVPETPENKDAMLDAKRLAAELFRNDCLFVNLQLPEFWQNFAEDLSKFQGNNIFMSFLRFFHDKNLQARIRVLKAGEGEYFKYYNRAIYDPEEVVKICKDMGIPISDDFKVNLTNLFLNMAPQDVRDAIISRFPGDFDPTEIKKREDERKLLAEVKGFLGELATSGSSSTLSFGTTEQAGKFRAKLETASRVMKIPLRTETLSDTSFTVRTVEKKKWDKDDVIARDARIKELRLSQPNLMNEEIAEILDIPDHLVEASITRLVRRRDIPPKRVIHRKK